MRAPDARSLNFRGHLIIGRSVSKWKFQSACDKQVPPIDVSARIWRPYSQWRKRDWGKSFRWNRFPCSRITRSKEGNRQLVGFHVAKSTCTSFRRNVTIVWREAVVNSLPTDSVSCHSHEYSRYFHTINSFLSIFRKNQRTQEPKQKFIIAFDLNGLNLLNQ